ncbi:putative D-lactate protein [Coleophoma crateriformis]|uniref:D-lactate dehydrogenase (cytochrome) n=1 Tax=Coleophoma crateriformis TaxID=565419 RepID=A0A3D8T782_9HELO|nr:putative D-lactate protein [Coleophoma crateriformis]
MPKPETPPSSKSGRGVSALSLLTFACSAAALGVAVSMKLSNKPQYGALNAPKYATTKEMLKAIDEIRSAISEETISTDDDDLKMHGFSEWSQINIDTLPIAVAYPRSTEEVSKIAKICYKYHIPMIGFSGGSSIEGNFAAPYGGISVDFAHMDKIVAFHEDDLDVVVQPAVGWMKLNEDIENSGLFFPVDPSPSAKFGGMVGTNCSGTNAARYGTMKDWVLNLTVVLADGTIIKTRNRPRKSAAGYNLNGIFVGAEGTLGLVTEITLKLAVIPKEFSVAVCTFPTIRDAAATASAVMRAGVPIAALELLDDTQMKVVNKGGNTAPRVWKEVPTLFFKFSGSKASVADNIKEVQAISKKHNAGSFEFAKDEKEQHLLWSARKTALWSMFALKPEGTNFWSTDVAVPYSRVAEIIEISKKDLEGKGIFTSIVGHLGDGNFHEAIFYNKSDPVETAMVTKAVHDMIDRALEMEGTCTGEHSIGLFKKGCLLQEVGPDTLLVMKSLKQSLDPRWIMNPGKIFDIPE